ncbi:MAG TPA: dolichyl-phosphate-mannose-protein mannosyltransferase, partial [Isosphaeraceae bacterium]|nr:dolichyl-phosphate-mannose-protein mannosyltransferase [Isosphaeraceae bacterium]
GIWLGLAGLCRPSTLASAVLSALAGLIFGPGSRRQRIGRTLAMGAMVILVLAPWAARNAQVFGEPVWTTTHGGYTLALANNPEYYRNVLNGPPGSVWTGPSQRVWAERLYRSLKGLNEPEGDRHIRHQTMAFLREHPRDFLRASAARLSRFWGLAPAGAVYSWPIRWATFAWTLPFWASVAISLRSRRLWAWPAAACLAQVAALSLVHTVFWTDLRMRAPVIPALALMAAHAGLGSAKSNPESETKKNP